jgi:hypothetical protein
MLVAAKTNYLEMLNDNAVAEMNSLKGRYQEILFFLEKIPITPEDLLDYDKKLKDINKELFSLEKRLGTMVLKYRTLEVAIRVIFNLSKGTLF